MADIEGKNGKPPMVIQPRGGAIYTEGVKGPRGKPAGPLPKQLREFTRDALSQSLPTLAKMARGQKFKITRFVDGKPTDFSVRPTGAEIIAANRMLLDAALSKVYSLAVTNEQLAKALITVGLKYIHADQAAQFCYEVEAVLRDSVDD